MNEPDPAQVASLEDLAECLRQLRVRADRPSLRELEERTKHANGLLPGTGLKRVRLGRTTLNDVLRGLKFPKKAFLLTFVEALNVDLEADPRWGQAWDRLALQGLGQAAEGESEELRQQFMIEKRETETIASRASQEKADTQTDKSRPDTNITRTEITKDPLESKHKLSGRRFVFVTMPPLGEGVTEGRIIRWLKREGDQFEVDEPLFEVSTDKVDIEFPTPASGILRSITVKEDETAAVGAQLAVIENARPTVRRASVQPLDLGRVVTLNPRTYNDCRAIGEHFRGGGAVIINMTEMTDNDAKRIVDFSAGLIFGLRGSIERVTNKVFLLTPARVEVSLEDRARIAEKGFFDSRPAQNNDQHNSPDIGETLAEPPSDLAKGSPWKETPNDSQSRGRARWFRRNKSDE